jgi:hypothetical protein
MSSAIAALHESACHCLQLRSSLDTLDAVFVALGPWRLGDCGYLRQDSRQLSGQRRHIATAGRQIQLKRQSVTQRA